MDADQQLVPSVVSVMVVHEPGAWFDETLRSLAAQDYPNVRTLFLLTPDTDRGGRGEAEGALAERIRAVLPAAFVRELGADVGFGPAVNEVLRLVEGDNGFFLICHDDIALEPRAVRILVAEMFRSNAGIVGPKLVDWDQPRQLQHVGLGLDRFGEVDPVVSPDEIDQEQHDAVRDVFVLPSACFLVRADLFRTLGGFDPSISFHGDDVELCWRAHLTGARVVVAPDARVRHRERLIERRPDLNHRTLQSRHRMRAVATLTGGSRLFGRSLQMVALTLVEVIVGLFTGRLAEALSSLRALVGLVPRTAAIVARRRTIRGQRAVPEREVLGLQLRGSARLTSYLRGKETTTFVGAGTTVRRWREASFGPLLCWFVIVLAVVIGSRSFIRHGVPAVGEFLPFPDSPRGLLRLYRSSFDSRSYGSTAANPTGWAALAFLSAFSLFRMPLLMTMSVVGLVLGGALGMWRLATVFPSNRARIAATIVYVGCPLAPGVLSQGDWGALAWFAALPWLLHLLRRIAAIGTADPSAVKYDLPDGVADLGFRSRARAAAFASLVLALTAAFVPVAIVMFAACGALVAVATVVAGGQWRVAAWMLGGTVVVSAVAVALNLPWALEWRWADLAGPRLAGATGRSVVDVASLSADSARFPVLAVALYVPVLAALAITRAWRLTWSARGTALILGFGSVLVLSSRGVLDVAVPRPALLAAPIALGLALGAASVVGGFVADVLDRGFGWRQPIGVISGFAVAVGLVPGLLAVGNGAWRTPDTPLTTFLDAQLPLDPVAGDYRVLYVGDPRVIPVPAREYAPGVAYAVVDAGPLDFTDRFTVPRSEGDDALQRALQLVADGSTLRAGRLLAPHGIRYIVLTETDGVASTPDHPIALPDGLIASLQNQLDIGAVPGPPAVEVYQNESWMPVGAVLTGATAEASSRAGEDVLVQSDFSAATPALQGADRSLVVGQRVEAGVVHLAIPFDPRLGLEVGGRRLEPRTGFGLTTAFDVPAAGDATIAYTRDTNRSIWLAVQLILWIAVLAVAAGARTAFGRRRVLSEHDETIIDLADEPMLAAGVVGEVLGAPTWDDDLEGAADDDDGWLGAIAAAAPDDDRELPPPPPAVPARGRHSRRAERVGVSGERDEDPTGEVPRVVRSADITQALRGFEGERAPGAGDDDEVDLASLVQRTDELEGGGRIRRDAPGSPGAPDDDDADDGGWGAVP